MGRTAIGRARGGRSDEGRSIVGIGTAAASAAARTCTFPRIRSLSLLRTTENIPVAAIHHALPVPPGVSANSIAAAAGSYSAYVASGAFPSWHIPETLNPRTARPAPEHHGHPRGGYMDRHAQCRRTGVYAYEEGAEGDGRTLRPPPRRTRPPAGSPRIRICILFIHVPLLHLLFVRFRRRGHQHLALPSPRLHFPNARPPRIGCVRGAGGDRSRRQGCRPRRSRHSRRRDAFPPTAHHVRPRCVAFAVSNTASPSSFAPPKRKHTQSPFASRY
ncbi:hypothetical protein K438DRAFT_1283576 [Mycena galopus ATCC 62051]|nr:hypothetical protein K438DRAFT_1283576 [Mycena galopus ATCC 62051]